MANRITFRIGFGETANPGNIIKSLDFSYSILRELDASITGETRGGIEWSIDEISKQSPLKFAFVGGSRAAAPDNLFGRVQDALINGINALSEESDDPQRPLHYTDKLLNYLLKLWDLRRKGEIGEIQVYTSTTDCAFITAVVSRAAKLLTSPAFESKGSIVGSLDSITVHRSHEFSVWDEFSGRAVTCKFSKEMLDLVKSRLKSRVLVHGTIKRNAQSRPVSIEVEGIEVQPGASELPTIEEMSGLVDDLTEGSTLKDYLEEIRGG